MMVSFSASTTRIRLLAQRNGWKNYRKCFPVSHSFKEAKVSENIVGNILLFCCDIMSQMLFSYSFPSLDFIYLDILQSLFCRMFWIWTIYPDVVYSDGGKCFWQMLPSLPYLWETLLGNHFMISNKAFNTSFAMNKVVGYITSLQGAISHIVKMGLNILNF